ncbi:histone-lysine N-methyltransferase SETMAR, partial [Elysia marginata]
MIFGNRRIKQKDIAKELEISKERLQHIITDILGYRKVPARPHTSRQIEETLHKLNFVVLPQSSYIPDHAPSDLCGLFHRRHAST